MGIDIFSIEEHKVSRDLSGYMTYIYAPGGFGKTTLASEMPKPLLLACERGYNALAGVKAQDITSWSEIRQVIKQLADPRAKDLYSTIVVDTVDKASQLCEKYMCGKLGVENIGDGGWSVNGWAKVKREWETTFNTLAMMGYAIVFISHDKDKTFTRKDGTSYNQIVPSCSNAYNEIIRDMVDLQAYGLIEDGQRYLVFRSPDDSIQCKSRFKHMAARVPLGYQELVNALNDAIDQEDSQYVTEEKNEIKVPEALDFVELVNKFNAMVNKLQEVAGAAFGTNWAPRIVAITDKWLGNGKRVADLTPSQVEQLAMVVEELEEQIGNGI